MLTSLINTTKDFTIGWANLGKNIYGQYDDFINGLLINNNSSTGEGDLGYGMNLTALLNTSNPQRDFKSLRLTLAHELQHVADDFANKIPSDVPKAPSSIANPIAWRGEYSAYRTEFRAAHQLGQLSADYFSASVNPIAARRGPTKKSWLKAIRGSATSGIR